jgi:hypothetical protein
MPARPSTAVLGFRPHTYWTAVVALAGSPKAPQVLERRRIEFATGAERFVYHQAETLELAKGEALIEAVRAATEANAAREVGALVGDLQRDGVEVRGAVVSAGTAKLPGSLEEILRSHAYMHAAEGTFYRDVVAKACADLGLAVRRIAERDMPARAGERARIDHSTLDELLKQMGTALGPPWSEDYRLATQAAWAELGGA